MTPREQTHLFGHEAIEADLLSAWKKDRMPHSLLLTGPKGIGRATLAFRLAKFLLSNPGEDATSLATDPNLPVIRRIISGGHGDLQVIEPDPEKATKEISVDQVRQIKQFLSQTPMEGGWRIVIVDGEMNHSASNAVLKVLEEPPKKSLLIIMSESSGRVLPTIRSRCHMVKLKPLSAVQVAQVVKAEESRVTPDEMQVLTALCDGRPGLALQYHEFGAVITYRDLLKVLSHLSTFDFGEALSLSQKYSGKAKTEDAGMDSFLVVGDCLKRFIQKLTRYATLQDTSNTLPEEVPIFQQALSIRSALEWARVWESVNQSFRQAHRSHLDKTQVLFCSLCDIAGVKI
jgi:DNA polymerase III subunit delta'